jgi:hypothetical protein
MTEKLPTTASPSQLMLALRAARAAIGGEQDVERLRRRLEATLGAGGESALAVSGMEAQAALSGAKLWVLLLGAAVGVSALMYLGLHRELPKRNAAQAGGAPAFVVSRAASPGIVQPAAEALPAVVSTDVVRAPTSRPELRASPARKTSDVVRSSPERSRVQAIARSTLQSDPDAEIALVTGAQSLLARQPNEALALLTEHERRFPHGLLAQERDTLRIDAERALGRHAQALGHARAFVAQFPDSPQARGIQRWLAAQENAAADHNPARAPVLTP